jgi:YHS domain-containing protein
MSDWRHCDGPECENKAALNSEVVAISERGAEQYITLDCAYGKQYHFCSEKCLLAWSAKETKRVARKG